MQGYLWFHTIATPSPFGWIHQQVSVIHNYPLLLGILGQLVERSYINPIDQEPDYSAVRGLIRERKIYVYPALVTKALIKRVQFTGIGEGYINIKGKTRLTYPERGFNTLFLPGTMLKTYVLAPNNSLNIPNYIRIGAKRAGLLKVEKSHKLVYHINNQEPLEITFPANSYDSRLSDRRVVLLHHSGGDIVTLAKAKTTIVAMKKARGQEERIVLAYPFILIKGPGSDINEG